MLMFYNKVFPIIDAACLVQRSGWTRDMDVFLQWLAAIPFTGGGFSEVAIAEGIAEALMVHTHNLHLYVL